MLKIKLSEIQQVEIFRLKTNSSNEKYFKPPVGVDIDRLHDDIEQRGIIVPLVAKQDGTLLAGHRRLMVAKSLGLKTVPVQFVASKLTSDEEVQFLIRDNYIRRQLSPDERRSLYSHLVNDFEERIKIPHSKTLGINAREISQKTGINVNTIELDITNIRRAKETERIKESHVDNINERVITNYKTAIVKILNVALMGDAATKKAFIKITKETLDKLERMP